MLSWSSDVAGEDVDLAAVGAGIGDIALEHGAALLRFASACAGDDDDELASSRRALAAVTGHAFMIDAAAVAANFEMMTRLADGTGASMPPAVLDQRADAIAAMGAGELTSRR